MLKKLGCFLLVVCMILTTVCTAFAGGAYDKLNDNEKMIYEALLIALKDFYNPSQVRVLEMKSPVSLHKHFADDPTNVLNTADSVVLRLSGTNKMGGTLNKAYELYLEDFFHPTEGEKADRAFRVAEFLGEEPNTWWYQFKDTPHKRKTPQMNESML